MQIGMSISMAASQSPTMVAGNPPVTGLPAPENLFSPARAVFADTTHVDLNGNWTISPTGLDQIVGDANINGVRLTLAQPAVSGRPHFLQVSLGAGTPVGNLRLRLGGAGVSPAANQTTLENRPLFQWLAKPDVTGAYTFMEVKPDQDAFAQRVTAASAYDLGSTDPTTVACDVVLCLGDSNMSNAVSDFVSQTNLETAFDGRVWYVPCLRSSPSFANTMSVRHIPQPCHEPVQSSAGAFRMSPLMAFGARMAGWSAARGRPVLLLSLGDPGSGLNGTQDWRKVSSIATTGARMYGEMLAMLTAMRALGPAHQIVGAIVSLGANDTTGADYNTVWVPLAQQFIADLRADAGVPSLPVCWSTVGQHYEPIAGEDRGARMIAAIESLAQTSGSPNAVPGVVTVRPPTGNVLTPGAASDPHFNAAGMQANGRALADTLLTLL
jgi:hypothetical protein